jgi:23S rRNA (guanosine2251-2'-O)-methyltransferase
MAKRKHAQRDFSRSGRSPARGAAAGPNPSRRGRAAAPAFLYGLHPVRAALTNPLRRARRLVATREAMAAVAALPALAALPTEVADRSDLDRLLPPGAVHQGLALEVEPLASIALDDLIPAGDAPALIVALDQLTDPQNVGAVMRTAWLFGACGMVLTERHAPPESGALAKAAAGALDRLPIARVTNLARALGDLKAAEFWTVGLDGTAAVEIGDIGPYPRAVLVLGAEGAGMRRLTVETCDIVARIDMAVPEAQDDGDRRAGPERPIIDSLNVSAAAAVALYALTRRRRP